MIYPKQKVWIGNESHWFLCTIDKERIHNLGGLEDTGFGSIIISSRIKGLDQKEVSLVLLMYNQSKDLFFFFFKSQKDLCRRGNLKILWRIIFWFFTNLKKSNFFGIWSIVLLLQPIIYILISFNEHIFGFSCPSFLIPMILPTKKLWVPINE